MDDSNPYIAVVARRSRNLHKKLDKIKATEEQLRSGKALNEEQKQLVTSRGAVERAIVDVDAIRAQLEEVVASELAKLTISTRNDSATVYASDEGPLSPPPTPVGGVPSSSTSAFASALPALTETVAAAATAAPEPAQQPVAVGYDDKYVQNLLQSQIYKLVRTMHVCSRYQAITGTSLSPDVDYFGKCLLGMTSLGSFRDALQQSVRNATLFLDPVLGAEHEAIRGMNFVQLAAVIDGLAQELGGGVDGDFLMGSESAATTTSTAGASAEEEAEEMLPQLNFFAHDVVEGDEEAGGVTQTATTTPASATAAPVPAIASVTPASAEEEVVRGGERKPRRERAPRRPRSDRPAATSSVSEGAGVDINAAAAGNTANTNAGSVGEQQEGVGKGGDGKRSRPPRTRKPRPEESSSPAITAAAAEPVAATTGKATAAPEVAAVSAQAVASAASVEGAAQKKFAWGDPNATPAAPITNATAATTPAATASTGGGRKPRPPAPSGAPVHNNKPNKNAKPSGPRPSNSTAGSGGNKPAKN